MKSNTYNLRPLNWFTNNLRNFDPKTQSIFRCPVCLDDFINPVQVEKFSNKHIIPKSAGGSATTFVCNKCDSRIGYEIEGPLINYIHDLKILYRKEEGKLRGKIVMIEKGAKFPIHLNGIETGWRLNIPKPVNNDFMLDEIPNNGIIRKPVKYNLQYYPMIKPSYNIELIFLKIAYLSMFQAFGYSYILNNRLDWVRKLLKGIPEVKPDYRYFFPIKLSEHENSLIYILNGSVNNLPAILCIGRLYKLWYLVILPPISEKLPEKFIGYVKEKEDRLYISYEIPALVLVT